MNKKIGIDEGPLIKLLMRMEDDINHNRWVSLDAYAKSFRQIILHNKLEIQEMYKLTIEERKEIEALRKEGAAGSRYERLVKIFDKLVPYGFEDSLAKTPVVAEEITDDVVIEAVKECWPNETPIARFLYFDRMKSALQTAREHLSAPAHAPLTPDEREAIDKFVEAAKLAPGGQKSALVPALCINLFPLLFQKHFPKSKPIGKTAQELANTIKDRLPLAITDQDAREAVDELVRRAEKEETNE